MGYYGGCGNNSFVVFLILILLLSGSCGCGCGYGPYSENK